jgi:hypothetical protein
VFFLTHNLATPCFGCEPKVRVARMNAMANALKVLQDLVVNERETNMQLSLDLKKVC